MGGYRLLGSSPSPRPTRTRLGARPPYLSPRALAARPQAAAAAFAENPKRPKLSRRRRHCRASAACHAAVPPLPAIEQALQELGVVVRMLARHFFPSPLLSRAHQSLTVIPETPLTAGRRLQPLSPPPEPLDGCPVPPATFQYKPCSKPRPGTRLRITSMKCHRSPPQLLAAGA
jgi:hypothetical protein